MVIRLRRSRSGLFKREMDGWNNRQFRHRCVGIDFKAISHRHASTRETFGIDPTEADRDLKI
jgi:hypothetical protein